MTRTGTGAATACAAPQPASPAAALEARPPGAGDVVHYREEVRHPALARPETAEGDFRLRGDVLVRAQTAPAPEIVEIGERFVTVRHPGEASPRIAPLPRDMAAVTGLIRAAMAGAETGASDRLLAGYDAALAPGGAGWVLTLTPKDADARLASIVMSGCGARFVSIAFTPRGSGASRRIVFGP